MAPRSGRPGIAFQIIHRRAAPFGHSVAIIYHFAWPASEVPAAARGRIHSGRAPMSFGIKGRIIFFARELLELGLGGEQRRKPARKKDRKNGEKAQTDGPSFW